MDGRHGQKYERTCDRSQKRPGRRRSAGREHGAGAGRWDSRRDVRGAPRALTREVTDVARTAHVVHLYSRPHIDLQRVAGALCRS
ncbi:putative leader peptide [Streptomyces fumanus]|uniref:putative leader peptide n=1 Tax=Streptomyces fumanus TaxID=67302 RepID=UPI00331EE9BF